MARATFCRCSLLQHRSIEAPQLDRRAGIRELQRAGQIGHGGYGRPLVQVDGRLHFEGHPLPGLDEERTWPQHLERRQLRDRQELLGRYPAQWPRAIRSVLCR